MRPTPCTLLLAAVLAGCSADPSGAAAPREEAIYTTFHPTAYLAERIAGGAVPVVCPIPAGEDPISWQPERDVLARYQRAALIVVNGAGLERWVQTASLPTSRTVDSSEALSGDLLHYETSTTHSHGAGGEHTHEGVDGHTWLDPVNAREQARAILAALEARWPQHAADFKARFKTLEQDLVLLDGRLAAATEKLGGRALVASHPAYNYLGRRYGWQLVNLDLDPEAELSDKDLEDVRGRVEGKGAELILWESAPLAATAARIERELGLKSVVFSPCEVLDDGQREAGEDFLSVMNANVDRLDRALGGS